MACVTYELLQSSRLDLVDCRVEDGVLKAGWAFSQGSLYPVEQLTPTLALKIPEFMQRSTVPAELYSPNDTIDFHICKPKTN